MIRSEDIKGLEARRSALYAEYARQKGLPPTAPLPLGLKADADAWVAARLAEAKDQLGGDARFERPGPWGHSPLSLMAEEHGIDAPKASRRKVAPAPSAPWAVRMLLSTRPHQKGVEGLALLAERCTRDPDLLNDLKTPAGVRAAFTGIERWARGESAELHPTVAEHPATRKVPLGPMEHDLERLLELVLLFAKAARFYQLPPESYREATLLGGLRRVLVHLAAGGNLDQRAKTQLYAALDGIEVALAS